MLSRATVSAILALSAFAAAAPQQHKRDTLEPSLTTQLRLADSVAERYKLLPNDEDFVFDHNKANNSMANGQTFPALVGTGAAMAVAEVPGCTVASLHLHPRSAELFVVIEGRVLTEMVPESAVPDADGNQRVVRTELGPRMMTEFPQGSLHTQMNPDCEPALAVASFTSEDPGAGLVAAETFSLSDGAVANAFGQQIVGEELDAIRGAIPKGAFFEVEKCLAKCGKKRSS